LLSLLSPITNAPVNCAAGNEPIDVAPPSTWTLAELPGSARTVRSAVVLVPAIASSTGLDAMPAPMTSTLNAPPLVAIAAGSVNCTEVRTVVVPMPVLFQLNERA
jgi:hypothetical protein